LRGKIKHHQKMRCECHLTLRPTIAVQHQPAGLAACTAPAAASRQSRTCATVTHCAVVAVVGVGVRRTLTASHSAREKEYTICHLTLRPTIAVQHQPAGLAACTAPAAASRQSRTLCHGHSLPTQVQMVSVTQSFAWSCNGVWSLLVNVRLGSAAISTS
jgi:hypothetical protein